MADDFQAVIALRRVPGDLIHPSGVIAVCRLDCGEDGGARLEQEIHGKLLPGQAIFDDLGKCRSGSGATAEFEIGQIKPVMNTQLFACAGFRRAGIAFERLFVVPAVVRSHCFAEPRPGHNGVEIGWPYSIAGLARFAGLDIALCRSLMHPGRALLKV